MLGSSCGQNITTSCSWDNTQEPEQQRPGTHAPFLRLSVQPCTRLVPGHVSLFRVRIIIFFSLLLQVPRCVYLHKLFMQRETLKRIIFVLSYLVGGITCDPTVWCGRFPKKNKKKTSAQAKPVFFFAACILTYLFLPPELTKCQRRKPWSEEEIWTWSFPHGKVTWSAASDHLASGYGNNMRRQQTHDGVKGTLSFSNGVISASGLNVLVNHISLVVWNLSKLTLTWWDPAMFLRITGG